MKQRVSLAPALALELGECCGTCRFRRGDVKHGECHRYAPLPVIGVDAEEIAQLSGAAKWPQVERDDWCGEWAGVPEEQTLFEEPGSSGDP